MSEFFTYGTREDDFEKLKKELSRLFEVDMEEYESGWWGVYASGNHAEIHELKLYPNYVKGEGFHENNHSYKYLVSVAEPISSLNLDAVFRSSNVGFELLKHEEA